MRFAVTSNTGKGGFTVEADSVEIKEGWIVFNKDGKPESAFNSTSVAHIAKLDEEGNPRIRVHGGDGKPQYDNLPE